jgi:endogenous inhibitor of DNA gyrase (YacG/DUF329 family)
MSAKWKCPICKKPAIVEFKPFCSERCKNVDLGRWLKGSYVLPGRPEDNQAPDPEDIDN